MLCLWTHTTSTITILPKHRWSIKDSLAKQYSEENGNSVRIETLKRKEELNYLVGIGISWCSGFTFTVVILFVHVSRSRRRSSSRSSVNRFESSLTLQEHGLEGLPLHAKRVRVGLYGGFRVRVHLGLLMMQTKTEREWRFLVDVHRFYINCSESVLKDVGGVRAVVNDCLVFLASLSCTPIVP